MSDHEVIGGRYRLDRLLGEGAMGRVWLGHDLVIGRPVAVKQMLAASPDAEMVERAMREGRAAGRLHHQNAVTVFDLVTIDGLPSLIMEYVDGTTLADRMARGPLSVAYTASIGSQVAAGLAAAHRLGIVHRDVKPANILIDGQGSAKLADFGIARVEENPGLTGTGLVIGTVAYLAPEVAEGGIAGPPADVWSLGATLYAVVEGRPLFEGTNAVAVITQLVTRPAPAAVLAGPMTGLLARMLARDPAARPTADQVRIELAAAVTLPEPTVVRTADAPYSGPPTTPTYPGPPPGVALSNAATALVSHPPTTSRPGRRNGRLIAIAVALAVVAAGGVTAALVASSGGKSSPDPVAGQKDPTQSSSAAGQSAALTSPPANSSIGSGSAPVSLAPTGTGTVISTGQSTSDTKNGQPTIASIQWNVTQNTATVDVHLVALPARGWSVQVDFDTDNNPATGCGGTELFVNWESTSDAGVTAFNTTDCNVNVDVVTAATANPLPDGMRIAIPRGELTKYAPTLLFSILTTLVDGADSDSVPADGELKMVLQ
jgi:serine/threonine protein kinase